MDSALLKLAQQAILQLKDENSKLKEELDRIKVAQALTLELYKNGSIFAEQVESTLVKFASRSIEDLTMTKKALEIAKTAEYSLFSLSREETNSDSLDAATKFINALLSE